MQQLYKRDNKTKKLVVMEYVRLYAMTYYITLYKVDHDGSFILLFGNRK